MNDIGEPDEGKPHVRFDEGEQGRPSGLLWRDDYALYPKGGDKARRCLCWLGDNQTCSLLYACPVKVNIASRWKSGQGKGQTAL